MGKERPVLAPGEKFFMVLAPGKRKWEWEKTSWFENTSNLEGAKGKITLRPHIKKGLPGYSFSTAKTDYKKPLALDSEKRMQWTPVKKDPDKPTLKMVDGKEKRKKGVGGCLS